MNGSIKTIAVLTSGGDAPGMNAAIRAVTRAGIKNNVKVLGIKRGYEGLLEKDFEELDSLSVSNIMGKGGTMLHTARCKDMMTKEGIERAVRVCKDMSIDAVIIIGGDGSLTGGKELSKRGIKVMGIPATIDLDLACSDYTIGFDTAINTVLEAVYKLKDTSLSHERCSIIEVMGRNCGSIALWSGLASGTNKILIPEEDSCEDYKIIIDKIINSRKVGKHYNVVIVAEGVGNTSELATEIEKYTGIETRVTVLGHIQRGGAPTAIDGVHASFMGYEAVKLLLRGEKNKIVIVKNGKYDSIDINEGLSYKKEYNKKFKELVEILSI